MSIGFSNVFYVAACVYVLGLVFMKTPRGNAAYGEASDPALVDCGTVRLRLPVLRYCYASTRMALQYARLTLKLSCPSDTFFDHFPPLVAHAELVALHRHGALVSPERHVRYLPRRC